MNIFTAVSNLLIGPLKLFFELIYSLAFKLLGNQGLSIIFLSLAMNILVLPLYKKADAMQEEARVTEEKLRPWADHIKKNFSGDERFMILQTYYRQNNYKPTDALKGSVSLLLEVPFFMAAYQFLSGLTMIQGVPFGPIWDLGAPDGLIRLGAVSINLLPIVMTLINLISGYIYTKGFPLKSKIQLYGMALIFLVLLYDSPSGLVFYWTLNNLFSLGKNIFYKLKNPKKVLSWLSSLISLPALIFVLFIHPMGSPNRQILVVGLLILMQLPLASCYLGKKFGPRPEAPAVTAQEKRTFYMGCLLAALVTGLLIPSAIVANSPEEFVNAVTFTNPVWYVVNSLVVSLGAFLLWPGIFYMLMSDKVKRIFSGAMWIFCGAAVVDYMFFGKNYGNLAPNLKFDAPPMPAGTEQIQNLLVILVLAAVFLLLFLKKQELVRVIYLAAILAVVVMSVVNLPPIQKKGSAAIAQTQEYQTGEVSIPLNKNGKNVMVLMMDRAVGAYLPYIFQENPALLDQYQGFTYYPNTISHGMNTNIGAPGLMGGYEYTPDQLNLRPEDQRTKHTEAMQVMPSLFADHGYQVTIMDAPTGNTGVLKKKYPDMSVNWLMSRYQDHSPEQAKAQEEMTVRNLFCYGLFKTVPVYFQPIVYARGTYNNPDEMYVDLIQQTGDSYENGQVFYSTTRATGLNPIFTKAYRSLVDLPNITAVGEEEKNTFLFLANNTPHEAMMLQEPDYAPANVVDNTEFDAAHGDRFTYEGYQMAVDTPVQISNYQCNMAYVIQLGRWFDYLRENDVYDNTRIIIVSDHGRWVEHFPKLVIGEEGEDIDILNYNAVLMVKDFGAEEPLQTDMQFMTNADVPALAAENLIPDPVNPMTGNRLGRPENFGPQIVMRSMEHADRNNGPAYLPASWYRVEENIFDPDNWTWLNSESIHPKIN